MLPACGDNTIIFNIQIALLGVVLVTAFFYLWRMIGRVEDRLERLERRIVQLGAGAASAPSTAFFAPADEDIMEQIFGAAEPSEPPAPSPSVVVASAPSTPTPVTCEITPVEDEAEAEASSTASLSRTKIRKMSVEALRDACKERGLSAEGSRSQLMERLFA